MTIKKLKLSNEDINSVIDNNTSFPQKTHQGRQCSFVVLNPSFISTASEASVELFQQRAADSEWPITVMQTEHARQRQWPRKPNGLLLTSEREFSSPGAPVKRESPAECTFSQKSPSTCTQILQERLRSSWVPTSILLYSFCCSSLNVSFTFARFSPPSLQKSWKWQQLMQFNHVVCLIRFYLLNDMQTTHTASQPLLIAADLYTATKLFF